MTDQKSNLLTPGLVAAELAESFPGQRTHEEWENWLRGNRNHSKKALYRIPVIKIGRQVFYDRAEVHEFKRWHSQLQLGDVRPTGRVAEVISAFGIGMGGSSAGYQWPDSARVFPATDEATGQPFVQLHITAPRLTVYRLTSAQATRLAANLTEAVSESDQKNNKG